MKTVMHGRIEVSGGKNPKQIPTILGFTPSDAALALSRIFHLAGLWKTPSMKHVPTEERKLLEELVRDEKLFGEGETIAMVCVQHGIELDDETILSLACLQELGKGRLSKGWQTLCLAIWARLKCVGFRLKAEEITFALEGQIHLTGRWAPKAVPMSKPMTLSVCLKRVGLPKSTRNVEEELTKMGYRFERSGRQKISIALDDLPAEAETK
jgi:hypothetical protein